MIVKTIKWQLNVGCKHSSTTILCQFHNTNKWLKLTEIKLKKKNIRGITSNEGHLVNE